MIRLEKITKYYDHMILDNINLSMKKNNIYVVKGVSGSGKTTLLNIISGIDQDYDGEYYFDGRRVKNFTKKEYEYFRNKIGYMTQQSLLFHNLTIFDNLLLVKNDVNTIEKLSKEFDIYDKLDKFPNQLSGGERQRVSLVRMLLYDCEIIVLDEPTASLDHDNAQRFVRYIKLLENKLIIIATHKSIYDQIADEILLVCNGILSKQIVNKTPTQGNSNKVYQTINEKEQNNKSSNLSIMLRYLKSKSMTKGMSCIVISALICLLFLSMVMSLHYEEIYFDVTSKQYPYNIIELELNDYNLFKNYIEDEYSEYNFKYKGYNGYPLLLQEDSNFNISKTIKFGKFPKYENEVLVNMEFINEFYPGQSPKKLLQSEFVVDNNVFIISGIISDDISDYFLVYSVNPFYKEIYDNTTNKIKPAFFISYNLISQIGTKVECYSNCRKLVKVDDEFAKKLYVTPERVLGNKDYLISNNYNQWKNIIENKTSFISFVSSIVILSVCIISIFSALFISNQIDLNLFYRRREIGYLQLFHITKKKITSLLLLDHLILILKAIGVSLILFVIGNGLIFYIYGVSLLNYFYLLIIIIILISLYTVIVSYLPIKRVIKKSIKELIQHY